MDRLLDRARRHKIDCINRLHQQAASTGCINRLHQQAASTGCINRLHQLTASLGTRLHLSYSVVPLWAGFTSVCSHQNIGRWRTSAALSQPLHMHLRSRHS